MSKVFSDFNICTVYCFYKCQAILFEVCSPLHVIFQTKLNLFSKRSKFDQVLNVMFKEM